MSVRKSVLAVAIILTAWLSAAGAAGSADAAGAGGAARAVGAVGAKATYSGSLYFPETQVTAGAAVNYHYDTFRVPKGVRVALQRQFRPNFAYQDIKTLTRRSANGLAPGLPMGRFGYRLAFWRHGKLLGTTPPTFIFSYGPVTLAQLCGATSSQLTIGNCSSGTVPVGSSTFSYQSADGYGNSDANGTKIVKATHSTCRTGQISYTLSNSADSSAEADIQVDQPGVDPQTDATPYGTVSTLKFVTNDPHWDVVFWEVPAGQTVYWDGTFSCWTPTGQ